MTSLHVICDLPPPIKNPGYAYGLTRPGIKPESTTSVADELECDFESKIELYLSLCIAHYSE